MAATLAERVPFYIVFGFYMAMMLAMAVIARILVWSRETKPNGKASYDTFFTANKSFGSIALFFTFYSTIYSGVTIDGVPAMAMGYGYIATMWLSSAVVVGLSFLIAYPRFRRISAVRQYNSPTDLYTDKYNNRVTSILLNIVFVFSSVVYILSNVFSIKSIIQVLGAGAMDTNTTVWCIFIIIWISEALGGFAAVAMTDAIQSAFMLVGIVSMSIYAQVWYGGMGGSTPYDCQNAVALTTAYNGANVTNNGCLGLHSPWNVLYPTVAEESEFFAPKDTRPSVGIDANEVFNGSALYMFSFNILFFAFYLNPHWISRMIAARSDASFRNTVALMTYNGVWTTLPMIVVGLVAAANLKRVEAAGTSAFALFIDEMLSRGGASAFFGTLGACSAIAAIMSTVDSALIACTNMVSKDWLQNLLYFYKPEIKDQLIGPASLGLTFDTLVLKTWSAIVLIIGIVAANAIEGDDETITDLTNWINTLLWQGVAANLFALFTDCKGWPIVGGLVGGLAFYLATYEEIVDKPGYGTPSATGDVKDMYLDQRVWSGLVNCAVTLILHLVLPTSIADAGPHFESGVLEKYDDEKVEGQEAKHLDQEKVMKLCEGWMEPMRSSIGLACLPLVFVISTLCLPWYKAAYSSCTFGSYSAWLSCQLTGTCSGAAIGDCDPETLVGGVPQWAIVVIACYVVACTINLIIALYCWRTVDTENFWEALDNPLFRTSEPTTPAETAPFTTDLDEHGSLNKMGLDMGVESTTRHCC